MPELWPHQKQTVEFADDKEHFFDASAAGTGKTPAHIAIATRNLERGASRYLVVCPSTLMRSAWGDDITEWAPHLSFSYARAPNATRDMAFLQASDFVIMNTDALGWLQGMGKRWFRKVMGKRPGLIVDESSWLKNWENNRTGAALNMRDWFTYKTCLSGTPAPNTVTELWSQYKILDGGSRLGESFERFRWTMQRRKEVDRSGRKRWFDKKDARTIVALLVRDITIGHAFDAVMTKVPPMTFRTEAYYMSPKHEALYESMRMEAMIEYRGSKVEPRHMADLANKLLQIASGAVYRAKDEYVVLDNGRYEFIADLIEAREATVTFFLWKHQRDLLSKILSKRGISHAVIDGSTKADDNDANVRRFQDGALRVLLMHPKKGAFGLTLSRGTSVIHSSPCMLADVFEQSNARIRRGVQRQETESLTVIADGTRDEHAYRVFSGKQSRMDALNDLLQEVQSL